MSSSLVFTVPDGYDEPFTVVTDDDHTAWIIIPAAIGIGLTLLFAGIRLFVRRVLSPEIGPDDILLGTATLVAVVQCSLLLVGCGFGLGKSHKLLEADAIDAAQKLYYAATISLGLTLGLSKASVAAFLVRIAPFDPQRRAVQGLFALSLAWTITLTLVLALRCNLSEPWQLASTSCDAETQIRWEVLDTIGCLFELGVFLIPVWLVWGVDAIRRSNKAVVITMFAFRLPLIVFVVFRLRSYNNEDRSDPTLKDAEFIAWSQSELTYSLISSTIIIMRPFVNNLVTHYGNDANTSPVDEMYHMDLLKPGSAMAYQRAPKSMAEEMPKQRIGPRRTNSQATLLNAM